MIRRSAVLAIYVLLLFFISGCREEPRPVKLEETTRFAGISDILYDGFVPGVKGGRFVTALHGSGPKSFNPILADDPIALHLSRVMNAALVRRNQMTLEWEPWLAEKWEISSGEREITFFLRRGLRWSDGKPISSADWVFTSVAAHTPGIQGSVRDRFFLNGGKAVFRAVDEQTVTLILPSPYSGAFEIAAVPPLPSHILEPVLETGPDYFNAFWGAGVDVNTVVTSGPFVLSKSIRGRRVEMAPNPHYFEKDSAGVSLPYIDTYIVELVEDEDMAVNKLLAGEIDHCVVNPDAVSGVIAGADELDIELYDTGPDTGTLLIAFNQNPGGVDPVTLEWLTDNQFRLALSHLVDRKWIIDELASGLGYPSFTFLPPSSPYYWSGIEVEAPRFDPERAARLLSRAGFRDRDGDGFREDRDGNDVALTIRTNSDNPARMAICSRYSREAAKLGIRIEFMPETFSSIVTRLVSSYEWELILIGFAGVIDPIDQGEIFTSGGNQHLIEPGQHYPRRDWEAFVDAAWENATATLDERIKKHAFESVQRTWIEELPWVYTYSAAVVHAYSKRWGNILPRSAAGLGLTAILPRLYERELL